MGSYENIPHFILSFLLSIVYWVLKNKCKIKANISVSNPISPIIFAFNSPKIILGTNDPKKTKKIKANSP